MVLGSKGSPRLFVYPSAACNGADGVRGRQTYKKKDNYRHHEQYRRQEEKPFQDMPDYVIHFEPVEIIAWKGGRGKGLTAKHTNKDKTSHKGAKTQRLYEIFR
jgi:hypothetical protein